MYTFRVGNYCIFFKRQTSLIINSSSNNKMGMNRSSRINSIRFRFNPQIQNVLVILLDRTSRWGDNGRVRRSSAADSTAGRRCIIAHHSGSFFRLLQHGGIHSTKRRCPIMSRVHPEALLLMSSCGGSSRLVQLGPSGLVSGQNSCWMMGWEESSSAGRVIRREESTGVESSSLWNSRLLDWSRLLLGPNIKLLLLSGTLGFCSISKTYSFNNWNINKEVNMTVIQKEKSYLLERRSRRWEALKVGDSAPRLFSFLRHLALRFWNQTCCLKKEWKLISWIYMKRPASWIKDRRTNLLLSQPFLTNFFWALHSSAIKESWAVF